MNDDLEALLRDHYRAAADEIHADAGTVRRFQDAGHAAAPARASAVRRWAFPVLAAAVTAAVLLVVAVLRGPGARDPEPPRPLAPPTIPASPAVSPTPLPSSTGPSGNTAPPANTAPSSNIGPPSNTAPPSTATPQGPAPATTPAGTPPTASPESRPGQRQ